MFKHLTGNNEHHSLRHTRSFTPLSQDQKYLMILINSALASINHLMIRVSVPRDQDSLSVVTTEEWESSHGVLWKLFYMMPIFFNFRMRIYAGFTLSECACIMSGN